METAHPDTKNDQKNTDLRKTGIDPNFWYPIVRSSELKAGKALDIEFAGTSIVVVRPKAGQFMPSKINALTDKFHFMLELFPIMESNAAITAGNMMLMEIALISPTSRCKKQKNRVRSFPTKEAYGLIFIYPGDNSKIERYSFPRSIMQIIMTTRLGTLIDASIVTTALCMRI